MAEKALMPGDAAPDFELIGTDGKVYRLSEALKEKPILLLFFKTDCPTSPLAVPYHEKLRQVYPQVEVWGISQDGPEESMSFVRQLGGGFPVLLDQALQATIDYGLTTVPTLFRIDEEGNIKDLIQGFSKEDLNRLSEEIARDFGVSPNLIAPADDGNPSFRPG